MGTLVRSSSTTEAKHASISAVSLAATSSRQSSRLRRLLLPVRTALTPVKAKGCGLAADLLGFLGLVWTDVAAVDFESTDSESESESKLKFSIEFCNWSSSPRTALLDIGDGDTDLDLREGNKPKGSE